MCLEMAKTENRYDVWLFCENLGGLIRSISQHFISDPSTGFYIFMGFYKVVKRLNKGQLRKHTKLYLVCPKRTAEPRPVLHKSGLYIKGFLLIEVSRTATSYAKITMFL